MSNVHDFTAGTGNFAYAKAQKPIRLGPDFGWWLITMIIQEEEKRHSVLPVSSLVCNFQGLQLVIVRGGL